MGIEHNPTTPHWKYFLLLEEDLERLARFVEFDKENFACFSAEIARILMAAAAEVEVACKQICSTLKPEPKADKLKFYQTPIVRAFPNLPSRGVLLPRFDLEALAPWENWGKSNPASPCWWEAYQRVKHHRHKKYNEANLKNALNAVAGLFVMNLYLYSDEAKTGELFPASRVFKANQSWNGGSRYIPGVGFADQYILD